jgi:hypothetical protein
MRTTRYVPLVSLAAAGFLSADCYQSAVDLADSLSDTPGTRDDGGGRVDGDVIPDGPRGDVAEPDDGETLPDSPMPPDAPDVPVSCSPELSGPYTLAPAAATDGEERPVVLASARDGQFVSFIRLPGPMTADGLQFRRLGLDGTDASAPGWMLSSVELGPRHPLLELPGDGFVAAFTVPEGASPGLWLKVVPSTGMGGEVPQQVPETDASCLEPSIAFDGTSGVVMWNRINLLEGWPYPDELRAQRFDPRTGVTTGVWKFLAEGAFSEAEIVWADSCFVVAFADGATAALRVLVLDEGLDVVDDRTWAPEGGTYVVGAPAMAWTGSVVGVLFEVHDSSSSSLMLAAVRCDEVIAGVHDVPMDGVLSPGEPGEVALAWAGDRNEWGIAWTYVNSGLRLTRLARVDADDYRLVYGPAVMDGAAEWSAHPAIAYTAGYYGIVWTEGSESPAAIRVATLGCAP